MTAKHKDFNTKERIFDVALQLFAERGYHGVSVRTIVREVGIKESSLYNHYSSKEALLLAIFHTMDAELSDRILSEETARALVREHSLEELLLFLLQRFISHWQDPRKERMWFVVSMEQYRRKEAAEIILRETERSLGNLVRVFQKLIEAGTIPGWDPEMLAIEYGYGTRALHLEWALRQLHDMGADQFYFLMEDRIRFFCRLIQLQYSEEL